MKSAKRKELKLKRSLIESREYLCRLIEESFSETYLYKNAEVILMYYSVGSEVSTQAIFEKALSDNKLTAFPVCLDSNGVMSFYYVNGADDLEEGMYGIKAPKEGCEQYGEHKNSLCIVPGLAFDKRGYRIGYGKGYYDRFLENFNGITVGFCYEEMVEDILPADEFDKKVDYLITDKKIYKFTV